MKVFLVAHQYLTSFTSLSLLFLRPRTKSVRFLSNNRWKLPFTCFKFKDISFYFHDYFQSQFLTKIKEIAQFNDTSAKQCLLSTCGNNLHYFEATEPLRLVEICFLKISINFDSSLGSKLSVGQSFASRKL